MKSTDSLVITNSNERELFIIARGPNLDVAFQSGWNLVSLPAQVENSVKSVLFPTSSSMAFQYDPIIGYNVCDTLRTGSGYWLKFPTVVPSVWFPGELLLSDTISIANGWNLVGALGVPVAVSHIGSDPAGIVTGKFYAFNAGYYTVDTLTAKQGYWVKSAQAGSLFMNSLAAPPEVSRISIMATGELPPPPPDEPQEDITVLPRSTMLLQNYPNPFNPTTVIQFDLPKESRVTLKIYDVLGREVAALLDDNRGAGSYKISWNASGVPSGVYFYRLQSGDALQTRKLLLIR
jgi:hypothetical protein